MHRLEEDEDADDDDDDEGWGVTVRFSHTPQRRDLTLLEH